MVLVGGVGRETEDGRAAKFNCVFHQVLVKVLLAILCFVGKFEECLASKRQTILWGWWEFFLNQRD